MNEQSANQTNQPQSPPQVDLTGLVDDSGKIMGKYNNGAEAVKGYHNAVQEMNATKERLSMAMQVIQQLQQGQPQPTPQVPSYEAKLENLGIPLPELNQLVQAQAGKIAKQYIDQQLTPYIKGAQARAEIATTYPDFVENESAIMQTIRQNDALARRFDELLQVNQPYVALEQGYFHWKNSKAPAMDPATEAAKRAAQTPQGTGGVNRNQNIQQGASQQEIDAATQHYLQTGDATALFDAKLKNIPLTYSEQLAALIRGNN